MHYDPKIKLRYFWNDKTQTLVGSVHWDNRTEGPPGGAHGASIMFVFDEILAYPVWRTGVPAFTANVNVNLRKMVPFNIAARFQARVAKAEGRKRWLEGVITTADGQTKYADATGLWIVSPGIGTTLTVHGEVVEADAGRAARGERALVAPFQISAAKSAARLDMRKGPLSAPDHSQVLPFQTDLYKGEASSKFADAVPTPKTFPRFFNPLEKATESAEAAQRRAGVSVSDYFLPSRL